MGERKESDSDSFSISIIRAASNDILDCPKLYASLTNTGGEIRLNAPGLSRADRHGNHKEHPVLLIARLKPVKRLLWFICGLKSPAVVNLYIRWRSRKWLTRGGQCLSPETKSESVPTVWVSPTDDDYAKLLLAVSGTAKATPPIGENLPSCVDILEAKRDTGLGIQILGDKEDGLAPSGGIPERCVDDRGSSHDESENSLANVEHIHH